MVEHLVGVLGLGVDEADAEGETPLLLACRGGFVEAAQALLAAGAAPRARGGASDAEALHHAAASGCPRLVAALLAAGAEVDAPSAVAGPPLMWAAAQAHAPCVAELLAAGADVRAVTPDGLSALVLLAALGPASGATDCVALLSAAGADASAAAPSAAGGFSALHVAADSGAADTAAALLAAGADPEATDCAGLRPLDVAAAAAAAALVALLLPASVPPFVD